MALTSVDESVSFPVSATLVMRCSSVRCLEYLEKFATLANDPMKPLSIFLSRDRDIKNECLGTGSNQLLESRPSGLLTGQCALVHFFFLWRTVVSSVSFF